MLGAPKKKYLGSAGPVGGGSDAADSLVNVTSIWASAAAWAKMSLLGALGLEAGYEEGWGPQSGPPEEGSGPELVLEDGSSLKTVTVHGVESSSVTGNIPGAGEMLGIMD